MAPRILTESEIVALAAKYSGIDPSRWAKYTEPFLFAESAESEEIHLKTWSYDDKLLFLLETAQHGVKPH